MPLRCSATRYEQETPILKIKHKFIGIIVTIIFIKNISQIESKILATHCFFRVHLKHKTVNKRLVEHSYPHQLCTHYLTNFPIVMIIFWGFQDFLIYLVKYFWSLLNCPNLIFQQFFVRAMYQVLTSFYHL